MPTLFTMNADVFDFISPNLVGSTGLAIHFDLVVDGWMSVSDTTRPALLLAPRVTGYVRSNGRMYDQPGTRPAPLDVDDPGNLGVRLLANDVDLNVDGNITYDVTGGRLMNGRPVAFAQFNTGAVPSTDITVNLADYAPSVTASGDGGDIDGDVDFIDGGGA